MPPTSRTKKHSTLQPKLKPKRHRHLNEGVEAQVSGPLGVEFTPGMFTPDPPMPVAVDVKPTRSHHRKPEPPARTIADLLPDVLAGKESGPITVLPAADVAVEDATSSASVSLDRELEESLHAWYRQLAEYLKSRKFEALEGSNLKKAEIARAAIEGRLSGTAPTSDFMAEFYKEWAEEEKVEQQKVQPRRQQSRPRKQRPPHRSVEENRKTQLKK